MRSVKLVYFSPTGTTKRVVRSIADGIGTNEVETIDITSPEARQRPLQLTAQDLLVIGVPVYMGRVPALLEDWLNAMKADKTPAVCVVVYGNRAYENALIELKDIVTRQGCIPIAGAACVGEHSFSDTSAPTAHGRPDATDQQQAESFGKQVREKLTSNPTITEIPELVVPGSRPYGGITELWDVDFITVNDQCAQCGVCATVCPMGAVDPKKSTTIDTVACITCCACIKNCPQEARSMKPGPVQEAQMRLIRLYSEPLQPDFYL